MASVPRDSGDPSPAVRTLRTPSADPGAGSYDRVPPHNLDAEVSVLGGMLLSKNAIAEVVELVGPEDFYRGAHRTIFEAIRELYDRGEPVDAVTLADALTAKGQLEGVGGAVGVMELVGRVPTAANVLYYSRIVAEQALRRRLIETGTQITRLGYEPTTGVAEAVDTAESLVFQVAQHGRSAGEFTSMKELLRESFELIEKLHETNSTITGLETGFHDFDELTAGLQPGNLVILAARPAMGKSTLVTNIATHVAVELRRPVVMFSLEMSTMELVQRVLSAGARVDSKRLKTGTLQESDWPRLSQAMGRIAEAPLFLDDNSAINLMEIRSKCRRLKQRHGLDLVIVDYLQLMQGHRRAENRVQEVSELSRGLKILAKELDVPLIALSQLSRKPEDRTDRRPQLADLRESGCLTGDARVLRADTGGEVTIADLYETGARNVPVWTLGPNKRFVVGTMSHAFFSGIKPVFRLRFASGRQVTASANHPFLTLQGWRRLDELAEGSRIAVPRSLPAPTSEQVWADDEVVLLAHLLGDGLFGLRSPQKFLPEAVFGFKEPQLTLFLHHLWSTAGHIWLPGSQAALYYATASRRLADDLQLLLLRLGIQSRLRTVGKAGHRERHQLCISDAASIGRFLDDVGVHRLRGANIPPIREEIAGRVMNTNVDTEVLDADDLRALSTTDLLWDRVVSVEALGDRPTFDATVNNSHSFVANNVVVHNSIEQDADVVAFIYRDEVYNEDSSAKGEAELIVAKHRNGPLKTVRLAFLGNHSRFASMARTMPPPARGGTGSGPL